MTHLLVIRGLWILQMSVKGNYTPHTQIIRVKVFDSRDSYFCIFFVSDSVQVYALIKEHAEEDRKERNK